jgi:hypothetical protein
MILKFIRQTRLPSGGQAYGGFMSRFKRSMGISFQVMNWPTRSMDVFF